MMMNMTGRELEGNLKELSPAGAEAEAVELTNNQIKQDEASAPYSSSPSPVGSASSSGAQSAGSGSPSPLSGEVESSILEFSSLNTIEDNAAGSELSSMQAAKGCDEEEDATRTRANGSLSEIDQSREQADAGQQAKVKVQRSGAEKDGQKFVISWHELSYVVESKWYKLTSQRKPILNKMSGSFRSGELSAVLGPSGAGKSTLIDCLVGKRESRNLSGRTQVNFSNSAYEQERRSNRPFKIATIPQADHLLDTLSVTETFMFASRIKNAHLTASDQYEDTCDDSLKKTFNSSEGNLEHFTSKTKINKKKRSKQEEKPFNHFANVQRVIQQLNLSSCAMTRCGKLSGGQYKRVSIGQELLSRPDLMILDEPTSGLDSVTCQQTVSALRHLIESSPYPIAIVATIHQPDFEVFQLFHKAYVIAEGGRAIYEGPIDSIFGNVSRGLELVEWRRSQSGHAHFSTLKGKHRELLSGQQNNVCSKMDKCFSFSSATEEAGAHQLGDPLETLRNRLELHQSGCANPARLLVELAAGEFGFEIQNAMNELQSHPYCTTEFSGHENEWAGRLSPALKGHVKHEHFQLDEAAGMARRFEYEANEPESRRAQLDRLLKLGAANKDQLCTWRVWWRHLLLHTNRSWLTILRDPMTFAVQVILHILIPLMISYAFQNQLTRDACPRVGPFDVVQETYRQGNVLDDLNLELRVSLENLGYLFFQLYVIIFAAVCVTSLTYPLVMHVLLKEHRNGWYSMSSYFLGRTLADLPVPSLNVILAIAISYHLTGQPVGIYHWRYWSVALLTVLATLVAQTMGLFFGAILMNAPQSAVFVAPASTAPLVVVCGFLLRINSLPYALQVISKLSYFTHLINGVIISRYGFNRCPCEPDDFLIEQSHLVPSQTRALIDVWLETFALDYAPQTNTSTSLIVTQSQNQTQEYLVPGRVDLVGKLVSTITRAKNFDFDINTCDQVKPFVMLDYQLNDSDLYMCFLALIVMLIASRWFVYLVLTWRIRSRI